MNNNVFLSTWNGTVGSGTQISAMIASIYTNNAFVPVNSVAIVKNPTAGSTTYNVGYYGTSAGTTTINAGSGAAAYILVECC